MVTNTFDIIHYPDTGCELSPSCLGCPREMCIYDEPVVKVSMIKRQVREIRIRDLSLQGWEVRIIADHMRVSERTVQRALEER